MSVVFPAPLGPRYPNAEPRGTFSSTESTTVLDPNFLVRPRVSTAKDSSGEPPGPGSCTGGSVVSVNALSDPPPYVCHYHRRARFAE